jgi:hypothetical protein
MKYQNLEGSLLRWFKIGFGDATYRTNPIIRNIFKWSTGCNIAVGIPFKRIIDVAADGTFIFFHERIALWFVTKV